MYTTGNTANMVLPYWNEIKNWSREDRSNLAELIQRSFRNSGLLPVPQKLLICLRCSA